MSTTGWGHGSVVYLSKASDGTLRDQSDPASASKARAGGAAEVGVHPGLGQLLSTSIAGNDLLSSCLYTGGICAAYAGKLAPLSLLLVSVMLYFFRFVYGEVVTAMPMNGGSYTALNNTTSKRIASLAACLSMLSYVATAVVSAESAVQYLQLVAPSVPTLSGTVVVLGIFALLNLLGISESAGVATVMFVIHVITLCVLCVWSLVWAMDNKWAVFKDNLGTPYPDTSSGSFGLALYFGYAAALLGITGFETAANYVEEMKDCQTYIFTLRNMWISVSLFNPILGALSMAVMPLSCAQVPGCTPDNQGSDSFNFIYKYQANLLGPVAGVVGGKTFKTIVCIDGVIVLAGSVLTAYVGIVGLVRRMSLDRCLPAFLLQKNSLRGTQHWIILGFFAVCSSLLLLLQGDVDMLSSVYNIAFLSVMTAFAVACGVLKWKRPHLSRLVVTSPLALGTALVFVLAGLLGNILRAPVVLAWFFLYFGAALSVVLFMFSATGVLQTLKRLVVACLPTEAERAAAAKKAAFIVRSHVAKEAPLLALGGGGGAAGGAPAMPLSAGSSSPSLNAEDSMQGALLEAYAAAMPGEDGCCEQDFSLGDMEESGIRFIREEAQEDEDIYSSSGSSGSRPGSSGGVGGIRGYLVRVLNDSIHAMNAKPVVYFAKHADLCGLNKAVAYVRSNEQTHRLVVVHCVNDLEARKALILGEEQQGGSRGAASVVATLQAGLPPSETQRDMIANVALLDAVYRAAKLRIDCLIVRGSAFSQPVIRWVGEYLGIGTNMMFMAMPDAYFPHKFSSLGGLRIITRTDSSSVRERRQKHSRAVIQRAAKELGEWDAPAKNIQGM